MENFIGKLYLLGGKIVLKNLLYLFSVSIHHETIKGKIQGFTPFVFPPLAWHSSRTGSTKLFKNSQYNMNN